MNETLNWEDENWRRGDKSRIAAIAVYCIIIVMALVGVGVRYFITQYEVSQANAQLGILANNLNIFSFLSTKF